MAMTTTIIKKNANMSTAGVRTRECVLPQQDTLKGTSKAEAGKLLRERAGGHQTPATRMQLLLVGIYTDNRHFKSIAVFPLPPPLCRLIMIVFQFHAIPLLTFIF